MAYPSHSVRIASARQATWPTPAGAALRDRGRTNSGIAHPARALVPHWGAACQAPRRHPSSCVRQPPPHPRPGLLRSNVLLPPRPPLPSYHNNFDNTELLPTPPPPYQPWARARRRRLRRRARRSRARPRTRPPTPSPKSPPPRPPPTSPRARATPPLLTRTTSARSSALPRPSPSSRRTMCSSATGRRRT